MLFEVPSGAPLAPQSIRMPPKFSVLKACVDGPFRSLVGDAKQRHAMACPGRYISIYQ